MAERPLPLRIQTLQVRFVRRMNDIHIFVQMALPLLKDLTTKFSASEHKKDRRYDVPAVKPTKFARRKDKEIAGVFDYFTKSGIYQTFLVSAVSHFEAFLGDVLKLILKEYPRKLTASVKGMPATKDVPIGMLLDTDSVEEAVDWAIERAVESLFYASPATYLAYLKEIAGIDTTDTAFQDYLEIKATRDLIIHNSGIINDIYLTKAGDRARGQPGAIAHVDSAYFDWCIANLKRLSGIIKRDAEKTFPVKQKKKVGGE